MYHITEVEFAFFSLFLHFKQVLKTLTGRYQVILVKVTQRNGKPRREVLTRLASIDEQPLHQKSPWAWRAFWYSVHCALCRAQVEPETYRDILVQLSQWIRLPESEAFRQLLVQAFEDETAHIDRELRDLSQRQQRLWKQSDALKEIREYSSRYL